MSVKLIKEDVKKLVRIQMGHLCAFVNKASVLPVTFCIVMVNSFILLRHLYITVAKIIFLQMLMSVWVVIVVVVNRTVIISSAHLSAPVAKVTCLQVMVSLVMVSRLNPINFSHLIIKSSA